MKNKKKLYLTEKLKLDDKKIKEHISSWSYETKGQDGNPIIKQKKKQSYTPFDVPKKSRLKGLHIRHSRSSRKKDFILMFWFNKKQDRYNL